MLNQKIYITSFCVDVNQHILTLIKFEDKNKQVFKFYDNGYYYEIIYHYINEDTIEILVKRQNYDKESSDIPSINHRTEEKMNVYLLGTNLNKDELESGLIINNLSYRKYEITLK